MQLQLQYYFKYLNYDLCRYVNSSVNPVVFIWEIQLWKIFFFSDILEYSTRTSTHIISFTPFLKQQSLPSCTAATAWQMSLLKQFLKAGISECASSIPTVQKNNYPVSQGSVHVPDGMCLMYSFISHAISINIIQYADWLLQFPNKKRWAHMENSS